ncbi:MAG: hypothetical protein VB858_14395, partial [Planctomycetaceae bacterium]
LGITVLGDYILSEGPDPIIENLLRAGATAVACNPTVTAPGDESTGSFQPPVDAGSSPRLFDRPLFGKRSLWVRSGVSYYPRQEFYQDSAYPARKPNDLTDRSGAVIGEFISKAVEAGLQVYLQVGAVQPSGLRDEDKPRLPDGSIPAGRMASTGSLASEAVRSFNRAYVRDLLHEYPQVHGFRPDWPEYPCYTLGEVFQDFGDHVARWAGLHGFDFESIRKAVASLYDLLLGRHPDQKLTNSDFEQTFSLETVTEGVRQWLRLKAALSVDLLNDWRNIIAAASDGRGELSANAFMTPYSFATGFDFSGAADVCDAVSPKFYTMHWSLMVRFWAEPILHNNPQLDEKTVVDCLVRMMDIGDGQSGKTLSDYGYPAPDEPHPIPDGPQLRKLAQVADEVRDAAQVIPLVHGYGPLDDFYRRLKLVGQNEAVSGLWINRYGYLGADKLEAIRQIAAGGSLEEMSE